MHTDFDQYRAGAQFRLTDEQVEICAHASELFQETLFPLQQKMDDEEWWPAETFREIAAMGYLGTTIPQEYGGQGHGHVTSGLNCETRACVTPAFTCSRHNAAHP